jgi:hypothetical protein
VEYGQAAEVGYGMRADRSKYVGSVSEARPRAKTLNTALPRESLPDAQPGPVVQVSAPGSSGCWARKASRCAIAFSIDSNAVERIPGRASVVRSCTTYTTRWLLVMECHVASHNPQPKVPTRHDRGSGFHLDPENIDAELLRERTPAGPGTTITARNELRSGRLVDVPDRHQVRQRDPGAAGPRHKEDLVVGIDQSCFGVKRSFPPGRLAVLGLGFVALGLVECAGDRRADEVSSVGVLVKERFTDNPIPDGLTLARPAMAGGPRSRVAGRLPGTKCTQMRPGVLGNWA